MKQMHLLIDTNRSWKPLICPRQFSWRLTILFWCALSRPRVWTLCGWMRASYSLLLVSSITKSKLYTSLRTSERARWPSPLLTATRSGPTWPRSFIDGWRTCWAGMSFPLWGAQYRRGRKLHPAVGPPRTRPRPRHRRRLHGKRTRLHGKRTRPRPQRPLHGKIKFRPQRPLHPKTPATGRPQARPSAVGPRTPAQLPSQANVPGPSPHLIIVDDAVSYLTGLRPPHPRLQAYSRMRAVQWVTQEHRVRWETRRGHPAHVPLWPV